MAGKAVIGEIKRGNTRKTTFPVVGVYFSAPSIALYAENICPFNYSMLKNIIQKLYDKEVKIKNKMSFGSYESKGCSNFFGNTHPMAFSRAL